MAALRKGGQVPIGSARWVLDERAQMNQIQDQEMEDYAFVVRNEVEWLNEHIAEIFERDQSCVRRLLHSLELADGYAKRV